MISFKDIELDDKQWICPILRGLDYRSCDYNFTNLYIWSHVYNTQAAKFNGRLLIKFMDCGEPFYYFPVGTGPLKPAVEALIGDAQAHGAKLCMRGITKELLPELEEAFGGQYSLCCDTNAFDYVYSSEKLALLPGKKLHSKRNHINRFLEENDWSFEPLSMNHLEECEEMNEKWLIQNTEERRANYDQEAKALDSMFSNFDRLGLEGGLLRSAGEIIAYTIGEPLCSDTYVTHFEKAYGHIRGAYAMINREFARHIREIHPEMVYINREDDMGIPNLRKAKQSYYPDFLVEKNVATWC